MLENIHRVCFVVPALDEAAECTELEKNKHKFGIQARCPAYISGVSRGSGWSNAPNSQAAERADRCRQGQD